MPSYRAPKIPSSEITPQSIYMNRRGFIAGAAAGLTFAAAPGALAAPIPAKETDYKVDETITSFEDITHWNNFYEFRAQASDISGLVGTFRPQPWRIEIGGLVNKPMVLGYDEILKDFTQEERVYRMRCVEAWSMVIPWVGFPLAALIDRAEPLGSAKYVAFETVVRPDEMPNQRGLFQPMPWPYVEGLRLDEARHPLAILATGVYGQTLPNQNGAPIRLVVPWKYGFKGIKSIVKITLTESQPPSSWNLQAPQEYGFYANVNPQVDHPRWSQATERRIGEAEGLFGGARINTLPFNGYGEEVAGLYAGMDLTKNY